MIVYLRRRPLSLFSVVHANIPLRLPLRNAVRQSAIYRQSTAASVPLFPAKATEGAGALLLLRPQRCTAAAVVPPLPAKATEGARDLLPLPPQRCTVAAAVVSHERFRTITVTTAVLRRRPRDTCRVFQNVFQAVKGLHEYKLCDTFQEMALTKARAVHETSLLHTKGSLDRPGL